MLMGIGCVTGLVVSIFSSKNLISPLYNGFFKQNKLEFSGLLAAHGPPPRRHRPRVPPGLPVRGGGDGALALGPLLREGEGPRQGNSHDDRIFKITLFFVREIAVRILKIVFRRKYVKDMESAYYKLSSAEQHSINPTRH